jgi:Ca-activated chloride channel family protein
MSIRRFLACGVIANAVLAHPEAQTFRLGVEVVHVDALVTDGKRPITGLSAADFEIVDSGIAQRIDSVMFEEVPLRVMLVLDKSLSVKGQTLSDLKEAAGAVTSMLVPNDRSSLLAFSSAIALRASWTNDHDRVARAVTGVEAGGATALHDAAYAALTARDTEPGRPLILIFSDGDDNSSWLSGESVIDVARRNEAVVYAVERRSGALLPGYLVDFTSGLQQRPRSLNALQMTTSFLNALADETGGKHLTTARSSQLRETFVHIINEFRSRYLLSYTPRGVESDGWHPIEVRVKGRHVNVNARRGYLR